MSRTGDGKDGYLKPFLPRNSSFRVKKILERIHPFWWNHITFLHTRSTKREERLPKKSTRISQRLIELTSMESSISPCYLSTAKANLFKETRYFDRVWGYDHYGSDKAVDDLVRRLRKKMPHFKIETVHGFAIRV